MVNSTIHWINLCPVSEAFGLPNPYPVDSAIQRLNNRRPVEQLGTVQEPIFLSFIYLFSFYRYSTNNIRIETSKHYKIYNNYLNYKKKKKKIE